MSLERNLSIWIPTWRRSVFKTKHAVICCSFCVVAIFVANSNVLFLFGTDRYVNGTYVEDNRLGRPSISWDTMDFDMEHCPLVLYSYIPFAVILIANVLLVLKVRSQRVNGSDLSASQLKRQKSITVTIIAITLLFVVFTGVGTIVNLFIDQLLQTDWGKLLIVIADTICFTFHGLNIISLLVTNKLFRKEFLELLRCAKIKNGSSATKSSNTRWNINLKKTSSKNNHATLQFSPGW